MSFYERYVTLCREHDLSPQSAEMLAITGKTSGTITGWSKGSMPACDVLCRIAKYFDVTTDFLLGLSKQRNCKPLTPSVFENSTQINQSHNQGTISNTVDHSDSSNNTTYTTNNYYSTKSEHCNVAVPITLDSKRYFFALIDNIRDMTDEQLLKMLDYSNFILQVQSNIQE